MKKINKHLTLSSIMSFLCFFASATFTIALMQSQGYEIWAKLVFCVYAIPTETGKYYFSHEIFFGKKPLWRVYCCMLALMLFGISITASLVFSVNQVNKLENTLKKDSIEYKQAQKNLEGEEKRAKAIELKNNKQQSIDTLNKQILDLENTRDAAIKDLEKTRDSYPKNYLDVKAGYDNKIDAKRNEFNNQINTKREELLKLQSKEIVVVEETKQQDVSNMKLKIEDGMSSVFGSEENKKIVFFIFSLVLELTGIGFYIDSRMKKNKSGSGSASKVVGQDSIFSSSNDNKSSHEGENKELLTIDEDKETSVPQFINFDSSKDKKLETDTAALKIEKIEPEIFFDTVVKEFPKSKKLDL